MVRRDDWCGFCHDLKHAMCAPCTCMARGVACEQLWCPAQAEDTFIPPPVPTF